VQVQLVRGNHDAHAGDPPVALHIECVDAPLMLGSFACAHMPAAHAEGYTLAGHLHPNVVLRGRGMPRLRLPCFVVGLSVCILPAFAAFTGAGAYHAADGDALYAIADGQVMPVCD
jgi:metallophosphoesterase superfamily enzyme